MIRLLQILTLVAVMLMPFGMAEAVSAVSSAQHHDMAGMPMGHCPDEQPQPDVQPGIAACTMVCSAALPAGQEVRPEPAMIVCSPEIASPARHLRGLNPETADPPPKRS